MPTNVIDIAIALIQLGLFGINRAQAYDRLKAGVSARATAEGRELTEEELDGLKRIDDAAALEMKRGKAPNDVLPPE